MPDTLMIYVKAQGTKSMNLIINIDGTYLNLNETLGQSGIENETEISFFNASAFEQYKINPTTSKW